MKAGPRVLIRTVCGVALPMLAFLGLAVSAGAQVTLNLNALDALPEAASPRPPRHRHVERRPVHRTTKPRTQPPAVAAAKPAAKAAPPAVAAQLPAVPATPPPAPPPSVASVAPPAAPVPAAPAVPAQPPVVASTVPAPAPPASEPRPPAPPAQVAVAPAPPPSRTLQVGFAAGQSDLSPADKNSIIGLAHEAPRGDTTSFEVAAHAPAPDGDASTARRLSLARALAIRGALVSAGVPAASIYVRALGALPAGQGGNPDGAVVTVMGLNGAESKQASQR